MESILAFVIVIIIFALSQYTESQKTPNGNKETETSLLSDVFGKWKTWMKDNGISIIGWFIYGAVSLHLLYRFVLVHLPSESLAVIQAIPPFAALEFLVFAVGTVMLWKMNKPKQETPQTGTKPAPVPQKVLTVRNDWKTWVLAVLGYVLWGIGCELNIFGGGLSYAELAMLPEGMLYLPYAGISYAALLGAFVVLAMCSRSATIRTLGFGLGLIFAFASFNGFWFMPYGATHVVPIPALQFLGGTGIYFPADPMVPWEWIAAVVGLLYLFAKNIPKKSSDSDVIAVIVLIIAATIFLPQMMYL
jgi:hypothetical protein